MNTKQILSSSAGLLFFMLLFSKPYIARCQTAPTDNAPVNKEVRIELDSMVDADGNVNVERTIFIDGKQMPADFEWVEADAPVGAVVEKEVIMVKGPDGALPADMAWIEDDNATNGNVFIIKEVENTKVIKTKKRRNKHGKQSQIEVIE